MIRGFIVGFSFGLAVIFTAHNIYQYNKAFEHCSQLLLQVRSNLKILGTEIAALQTAMNSAEVDND